MCLATMKYFKQKACEEFHSNMSIILKENKNAIVQFCDDNKLSKKCYYKADMYVVQERDNIEMEEIRLGCK